MKKGLFVLTALALAAGAAYAAPILPTIVGHDFNFGGHNSDSKIEYYTNGAQADVLTFTQYAADREVTAYWPNWPKPPVYPVWDAQAGTDFGGDFVLAVQFTGQDAPQGPFDVSLTGTGLNTQPGAADLSIYGTIKINPNVTWTGLLWAIDLKDVVLYGYSQRSTYVLEGLGTIVGGKVAEEYQLVGQIGAMRGHLDFIESPSNWIAALYNPVTDPREDRVRAAYSGETGLVPEPPAVALLLMGLGMLTRRR